LIQACSSLLVGCWLGNYSVTKVTYGLKLLLDALIHLICEVIASLHFLAVSYYYVGFNDANSFSVDLDYSLAVKLGLIDTMVALLKHLANFFAVMPP
jgi:hypothetical protein